MPRKKNGPHAPRFADDRGISYRPRYALAVECKSEKEQRRIYNTLRKLGLEPKVLAL